MLAVVAGLAGGVCCVCGGRAWPPVQVKQLDKSQLILAVLEGINERVDDS